MGWLATAAPSILKSEHRRLSRTPRREFTDPMPRTRNKQLPPTPTWTCPHCQHVHTAGNAETSNQRYRTVRGLPAAVCSNAGPRAPERESLRKCRLSIKCKGTRASRLTALPIREAFRNALTDLVRSSYVSTAAPAWNDRTGIGKGFQSQ
jgi:hypothetical protein